MKFLINKIKFSIVALFLITPVYGQDFDGLLNELSSSETEEAESEVPLPPKKENTPLAPSSNDLQAAESESTLEEDDIAPEKNVITNGVTLQGLDKQTGRVFIIDARMKQPIEFGTLKIIVLHCENAPLENRHESMAFLKITEQKPNNATANLFSGWMFSSSPALSALDHPTYDVWIKSCKVLP